VKLPLPILQMEVTSTMHSRYFAVTQLYLKNENL